MDAASEAVEAAKDTLGGGRGGWLGAMKNELSSRPLPVDVLGIFCKKKFGLSFGLRNSQQRISRQMSAVHLSIKIQFKTQAAFRIKSLLGKEASGVSGMAGLDDDDEGTGVLVLSQSAAGLFPVPTGVSRT